MTSPTLECLFCGATSDTVVFSKEDVVPKWLLHFLALPSHDRMFHAVADSSTGEITKTNKHSSFRFHEPRVCKFECNNGWMSRLEIAAGPILKPLVSNTRALSSLTQPELATIGKWATKTAYMHAFAGLLDAAISLDHLRALRGDAGQPMPGVSVFGMQGDYSKPSSYVQTGRWPQAAPLDKAVQTPSDSYKVAMQFRHLYLLVAHWPDPRSRFLIRPWYFPVWSSTSGAPLLYRGTVPDNLPIDLLLHFASELAVVHSIDGL